MINKLTLEKNILKKLDSSDKNERMSILSQLTQIENEKIIEKIISLLDDDDIMIRGEVFSTLVLNKNDISTKLIHNLNSKSKNIKAFCSLILANRNDRNGISSISKLTDDPSGMVRSCAFGSLGHLKASNVRQKIHQGVFDPNIEVKKSAAHALTLINEKFSNEEKIELEKQDDYDFKKILNC